MANTIATCIGSDRSRDKVEHRLGAVSATARADTWRTFTTCHVWADGSGFVRVVRDGAVIHEWSFGDESSVRVVRATIGEPEAVGSAQVK